MFLAATPGRGSRGLAYSASSTAVPPPAAAAVSAGVGAGGHSTT